MISTPPRPRRKWEARPEAEDLVAQEFSIQNFTVGLNQRESGAIASRYRAKSWQSGSSDVISCHPVEKRPFFSVGPSTSISCAGPPVASQALLRQSHPETLAPNGWTAGSQQGHFADTKGRTGFGVVKRQPSPTSPALYPTGPAWSPPAPGCFPSGTPRKGSQPPLRLIGNHRIRRGAFASHRISAPRRATCEGARDRLAQSPKPSLPDPGQTCPQHCVWRCTQV